jgi:hypothetical protein
MLQTGLISHYKSTTAEHRTLCLEMPIVQPEEYPNGRFISSPNLTLTARRTKSFFIFSELYGVLWVHLNYLNRRSRIENGLKGGDIGRGVYLIKHVPRLTACGGRYGLRGRYLWEKSGRRCGSAWPHINR